VIMLTRALAKAFAPGITVNSVAPGVIPFDDIDERGKRMIEATPPARRHARRDRGRGGLFSEGLQLCHRPDAGDRWGPQSALTRRRAFGSACFSLRCLNAAFGCLQAKNPPVSERKLRGSACFSLPCLRPLSGAC